MAKEDALLSDVVYSTILPWATLIIIVAFLYRNGHSLSERLFAWIYSNIMMKDVMKMLAPHKEILFSKLSEQKSHSPELRRENAIRILEIGSGPGSNLEYFPKDCRLVCYDPNAHFRSTLFNRLEEFPHVNLERLVISGAESLVGTEDGSVDAVVSVFVLCTVANLDAVLKEVNRVLAPGGKFYFLEHTFSEPGTTSRYIQQLVNPLWKLVFLGCHFCDLESAIRKFGFSVVEMKKIPKLNVKSNSGFDVFIKEGIVGMAEK